MNGDAISMYCKQDNGISAHFPVTTKLESYTEFNIVLKIFCRFCSFLHPVTAEPVRFQSVPQLMKKMVYGKNILSEHKFKCCSSSMPFRQKMLQELPWR